MASPILTPVSTTSKIALPVTGTYDSVNTTLNPLPFGIYTKLSGSSDFISGAADQVSYTFKKLGGDVLDIELTEHQIYAAYEESCLEYSYIVNVHQAKNSLGDLLGNTTASFDHDGEVSSGHPLSGSNVELALPRYTFQYSQRAAVGMGNEANVGSEQTVYSASFKTTASQQDYDLQKIISASIEDGTILLDESDLLTDKRITVRRVYYMTGRAMWRFFAFYGGINVVGNLSTYGMYADDTTFEVVPAWQNKLQAIQYEDSIRTRISNFSYELHNNKVRLFPAPAGLGDERFWVQFTLERDAWEEYADRKRGGRGVNNMNSLPFGNVPYSTINSIGKQWIRRFALALSKEMLGLIRSKFSTVPIPGESITLNGADLISQGKGEQESLREELKTVLDELTYAKLAERDAAMVDSVQKAQGGVPLPIFIG
tara:strand:- start:127 stop:1410 length:1284 start_codon:yes stop_codon:yes gene_type:complete